MKQIAFTDYGKAELIDMPMPELKDNEVMIKTVYTAISTGTETANITGDSSMPGMRGKKTDNYFPRYLGYSEAGIVEKAGTNVTKFKPGDRVISFWGHHKQYQFLPEDQVVAVPDNVDLLDAAFVFIATFPLAAIRKCKVEIGESAMVVGLGILGQMAVQLLRIAGAVPVIAVNHGEARRNLALKLGADYAFNPADEDYINNVQAVTEGKGVAAMIEVTGKGEALNQSLRCMAKMGRVALLGCTRKPAEVDFYYDVHLPGIEMYGAHTFARPDHESYPGHWTHVDDCKALLKLISQGRLDMRALISEVHSPEEAPAVYNRMLHERDFPVGIVFDWRKLD